MVTTCCKLIVHRSLNSLAGAWIDILSSALGWHPKVGGPCSCCYRCMWPWQQGWKWMRPVSTTLCGRRRCRALWGHVGCSQKACQRTTWKRWGSSTEAQRHPSLARDSGRTTLCFSISLCCSMHLMSPFLQCPLILCVCLPENSSVLTK